jgi:hypothetical protein
MQSSQLSEVSFCEEKGCEKPITCTWALRAALVSELTEICVASTATSAGSKLFLNLIIFMCLASFLDKRKPDISLFTWLLTLALNVLKQLTSIRFKVITFSA